MDGRCISHPLYYLIASASLSACQLSINDPTSIFVLRLLGAFLGIAQFVFVFLSLRLLFPARNRILWPFAGSVSADAFVPAHYVTNEILASALATAALYLCLRLLTSETPRASQFAWLGLAMGAAMLAKATGILLLPIVIAAIAVKLAVTRAPSRDLVAQYRSAARDLFRGMRLALRTHLAQVRHTAARQLGCSQRVRVVAGPRLSHDG